MLLLEHIIYCLKVTYNFNKYFFHLDIVYMLLQVTYNFNSRYVILIK